MNEDDCDDELPPISVNSSGRNSKVFMMPSAKDVASERAREIACERELLLLRSCDATDAARSDSSSSSSEGEAALRAAVRELSMRPPPSPDAPEPSPATLARLLPAPAPDARFLQHYADLLDSTPRDNLQRITRDIVSSLCRLLSEERDWRDEEVVSCGAWLCVASASKLACAPANATRRALHMLLRDIATEQQTWSIGAAVHASVSTGGARLAACDAAHGAGRRGAALAALFASAALRALLQTEPGQAEWSERPLSVCELSTLAAARWRALAPCERYLALRLAGRLLAAGSPADAAERAARDRLLATLAYHPPDANHHPEQLKVLVGASALQVLFRARPDK